MSSVFEGLFLFWLVVMSLLSSWEEIDFRVELADDVQEAEDDKTGFLSVGMDTFDRLLKNDQFPCPWCNLVPKTKIWDMRISEKAQQISK